MMRRLLVLPLLLGATAGTAAAASSDAPRRTYIVQLGDKPVASYTGGVAGLAATKPPAGSLINPQSVAVQNYMQYLQQRRAAALAALPPGALLHDLKVVYNGFVARLTEAEALALKHSDGVVAVRSDTYFAPATSYTPTFLGLDRPGGLWSQLGGKEHAGEDMIIGVIDTGIWPENPAFADRVDAKGAPTHDPDGTPAYGPPPARWHGACQAGPGFGADACNNKLIGARAYNFLADAGRAPHWTEFDSPRDSLAGPEGKGGHGTHTSSTAAGNNGVAAGIGGAALGTTSGMAPRARLAMYKICFSSANDDGSASNGCSTNSAVAAIEQAVLDGVDVLSYSISGSSDSVDDPVEQAFLGAANAGVFVSVAGGNYGPGNAVNHPSPWLTTVAASTTDRIQGAQVQLSTGVRYTGASLNATALAPAPAILSSDAGTIPYANLASGDREARRLCYTEADRLANGASSNAALDPALVAGKVVICQRGKNAMVDKSRAVREAGGVGMILVDDGNGLVINDFVVPTVHVSVKDGAAISAAVTPALTIGIGATELVPNPEAAPKLARFSSRGPNMATASVLKPDLAAPGVNILAGFAPDLTPAQHDAIAAGGAAGGVTWAYASGTSMATPHVSGLAALLKQKHPDWSPAAIKSALMTTATPTVDDGLPADFNGKNAFGQGAGHVAPTPAADPGLVYDLGATDYQRFLCGLGSYSVPASVCSGVGTVADYDLNLASVTAANVADTQTIKRRVTNVGGAQATYTASASLPGFAVTVAPASLTLAPGASADYSVTLKRTSAANNAWAYGTLDWSDGTHRVRSPLTARTALFTPDDYYYSEGTSGNKTVSVTTAYNGKLSAKVAGLREATQDTYTLHANNSSDYGVAECAAGGSDSVSYKRVTIPAGTVGARFALYEEDASGGSGDDLNLLLLDGQGNLIVGSVNLFSSAEDIESPNPDPGEYIVCVVARTPVGGTATAKLSSWVIAPGQTGTGNLKMLTPSTVFAYRPASASYTWSGLAPGRHYMGGVEFSNGSLRLGATLIQVESIETVWGRAAGRGTRLDALQARRSDR